MFQPARAACNEKNRGIVSLILNIDSLSEGMMLTPGSAISQSTCEGRNSLVSAPTCERSRDYYPQSTCGETEAYTGQKMWPQSK